MDVSRVSPDWTRGGGGRFLQDEFKDVDLPVALYQPLQRAAELLELVGPKVTQRGQGEVHERQPRARGDRRDFRPERGGFFANPRRGSLGEFREFLRTHGFVRAEEHRVHKRGGIERLVSSGPDLFRE
jgi:hypothetical protein